MDAEFEDWQEHHHGAAQPLGSAGRPSWREGPLSNQQSGLIRAESSKYRLFQLNASNKTLLELFSINETF
jgi:hypothetical protein